MYKKNLEKYKTFTLLLVIGCLVILLWFKNQAIQSLESVNTEITYEITKFNTTTRRGLLRKSVLSKTHIVV